MTGVRVIEATSKRLIEVKEWWTVSSPATDQDTRNFRFV